MIILDKQIRVTINTWGGFCFYIPETPNRKAFCIWRAVGGLWACNNNPKTGGYDGEKRMYDSPMEAYWAEMGFGETVHYEDLKKEGLVP